MQPVRLLYLLLFFFSYITICPQAGTWTWMKGDSTGNSIGISAYTGVYGTRGVPSPNNTPPARYSAGCWTDTSGNFWVYGGDAYDDLWKFDPDKIEWTWINGDTILLEREIINSNGNVYDSLNSPGCLAFSMFTWVTADNHLWLFGSQKEDSLSINNDLWQYNIAINQWAWMGTFGPANYGTKGIGDSTTVPGGRDGSNCAWTDSNGNLWLFGGFDISCNSYNDIWEYNVNTGIWTWMSGSSNPDDTGVYGTIGQPSVNNYPAARSTNMFWKDNGGNFWLAGGTQCKSGAMFQDVWKFNPQTLEWTWVKGIQGNDTTTVGVNCVADTLNKDGPRFYNSADWKINDELIATYDGFPNWNEGTGPNDLWAYKMSTNEWLKINEWQTGGRYGIQGVTDPANYPTSRWGAVGFKDKGNNLWLFSGLTAYDGQILNDLWKYVPDTACINAAFTGVQQVQEEEQMQLYPNPCSVANVQLAVSSELIGSRLAVYDMAGQLVFTSAIRPEYSGQSEIPVSGLAAGVYFVQVSSPNGGVVRKLVKIN